MEHVQARPAHGRERQAETLLGPERLHGGFRDAPRRRFVPRDEGEAAGAGVEVVDGRGEQAQRRHGSGRFPHQSPVSPRHTLHAFFS